MLIGYNNSLMILQLLRRSQFIPINKSSFFKLLLLYPDFIIMSNLKYIYDFNFLNIFEINTKIIITEIIARRSKIIVSVSWYNLLYFLKNSKTLKIKNKIIPIFITKKYLVFLVISIIMNINIKIREITNKKFLNIVGLCIYGWSEG